MVSSRNLLSLIHQQSVLPMKTFSLSTITLLVLVFSINLHLSAQENSGKRWKLGALPAVAYDADMGFRYGALANFYDHGPNLELYPFYRHSIYAEWSHTTNGNDIKQLKYDSEYLIPGIRITALARLETEQAIDFYGFNGYKSLYDSNIEQEISRMYYRMGYRSLRLKADFQGKIIDRKLRWYAGVEHLNLKINSVDIDKINSRKDADNQLPDVPGLYDEFVSNGYIPADQANGGLNTSLKAGLVADTRNIEAFPSTGIWSEAVLVAAPGFIGNSSPYTGLVLTHRQYFPIIHNKLVFAYRLNYQTSLSGSMPWYVMHFKPDTYVNWTGLGGSKTLRGILRNRVNGEGSAMGNFEIRWKFVEFNVANQDVYLAISPFLDAGKITKEYALQPDLTGEPDGIHWSYGAGLHVAINENFIVAVDYGIAADKRDGKTGLYIGLDFLF